MKKFLSFVLLIALSVFSLKADSSATVLTANTAANLLSIPKAVTQVTLTATTTNITTVNFYDSATTGTTYVQAAYTYVTNYATNWTVVFTNEQNVLVTNTFIGTYTAPVTVNASTQALPKIVSQIVLGSGQRQTPVALQLLHGLTAQASYGAIVELQYGR